MRNGKTLWRWVTAGLALAAAIPTAVLWGGGGRGEDGGRETGETLAAGAQTPTGWLWRTLRGAERTEKAPDRGGPGEHYRLAGVLIMQEGTGPERGGGDRRFAILDRLENGMQLVLEEGEKDGAMRVVRIEHEYVLLAEGGREEMVFLAPSAIGGKRDGGGKEKGPGTGKAAPAEPLETNRFGARVGEARWEIERAELLKYAQEVMDDPRRVSGMYLGMEPDYNEEREIEGYRLNTKCGEAEFYGMIGLEDGDVIRRVNSIRMTSQRRAEFLMGEFFQERLGTVVLDIERDGEAKKLVYLLR